MQISPDVSVIIPTYNRFSMLEEALASVFAQEFDGVVETIVVDDNSQDGTSAAVSEKYPEVRLISFKENVGAYVTRNQALSEAKGKYIAFLDSDDLWEPTYLKSQIAALKGKQRCFSVSALIVWNIVIDSKQISIQKPNLKRFYSPIHQLLVSNFIITPSSVVFPRQVFDEVGLFDESLRVGADADLYIRCLAAGYNPFFIEEPLAIKREHGKGQLTSAKNLKLKERCRFKRISKFYALSEDFLGIVPERRRLHAEAHANLASQYFRNNNFWYWSNALIAIIYSGFPIKAISRAVRDIQGAIKMKKKLNVLANSSH